MTKVNDITDEDEFGLIGRYVFPEPIVMKANDRFTLTITQDNVGNIIDVKVTHHPKLHSSDRLSLRRSRAMKHHII